MIDYKKVWQYHSIFAFKKLFRSYRSLIFFIVFFCACSDLNKAYELEQSGKLDEAKEIYNRLCDQGNESACYNLGVLYRQENQ